MVNGSILIVPFSAIYVRHENNIPDGKHEDPRHRFAIWANSGTCYIPKFMMRANEGTLLEEMSLGEMDRNLRTRQEKMRQETPARKEGDARPPDEEPKLADIFVRQGTVTPFMAAFVWVPRKTFAHSSNSIVSGRRRSTREQPSPKPLQSLGICAFT